MWRALTLFVALLLGAGVYALVTGDASAGRSATTASGATSGQFGFALAAGAIALFAALFLSRPKLRSRR